MAKKNPPGKIRAGKVICGDSEAGTVEIAHGVQPLKPTIQPRN